MNYRIALLAITIVALTSCGDGSSSPCTSCPNTESTQTHSEPSAELSLSIDFPPAQGRYPGSSIPVRGRIAGAPTDTLQVRIDGGSGVVEVPVDPNGDWAANAVELGAGPIAELSVVVSASSGWETAATVRSINRVGTTDLPVAVAAGFNDTQYFLYFENGELREYELPAREIARFTRSNGKATRPSQLQAWPATGEVVAMITPQQGGCEFTAYDTAQSTERELLSLQWPPAETFNSCANANFTVSDNQLIVLDSFRAELLTVGSDGRLISTSAVGANIPYSDALVPAPQRADQTLFLDKGFVQTRVALRALQAHLLDNGSGAELESFFGNVQSAYSSDPLLASLTGSGVYFWADGDQYLATQTDSLEQPLETSGYMPVDVRDLAAHPQASKALLLDDWGRLSRLDLNSGVSELVHDFAPYTYPPVRFSDNTTLSEGFFLYTEHRLDIPNITVSASNVWNNLHAFDPDTLELQPLYTSSNFADGLSQTSKLSTIKVLLNTDTWLSDVQNSDYSLQLGSRADYARVLDRVEHATGELQAFDLGEFVPPRNSNIVVDLAGEFMTIESINGLIEFNIESQEVTRTFESVINVTPKLPYAPRLAARFPGPAGESYMVIEDDPLQSIVRVDFDEQRYVLVSGTNRGEGPSLAGFSGEVASWSHQNNEVHIGNPLTGQVLRVDLVTGDRDLVFSPSADTTQELPEFLRDIKVLADRNVMLASGDNGVFYIDLLTGNSVAIPLHIRP